MIRFASALLGRNSPAVSASMIVFSPATFFFFTDTATTAIYTLSLHAALPISRLRAQAVLAARARGAHQGDPPPHGVERSEEHTSELQSRRDLVCRLLLEK